MAALVCPVCCKEQFSSHESLKYHILELIDALDNLSCPSCNERCEDLMDLADHLGRECVNLPNNSEHQEGYMPVDTNIVKSEQSLLNDITVEDGVLDSDSVRIVNANNIADDPNMVYSCEVCDMTFNSVQEHLAKYHEGEEVILETQETDEAEGDSKVDEVNTQDETQTDDDTFDEDGSVDESVETMNGDPKYQVLSNSAAEPVTTKYIVEDGKVRKLSNEESEELSDKSRIIEVHSCQTCNLQFPNITHFNKHKCNNAKAGSKSRKSDRRADISKLKEDFSYRCTFCLAIYSSLVALNDHMKFHLAEDDSGLVQNQKITLSLHICDVCNTKFPTYKQLRNHSRMHNPVKSQEVEDPVSYDMLGQEDTKNGTKKRQKFKCTICDKFYDMGYKEIHMKSHENDIQHICLVCNRKFESKENLELHTKAHSKIKKFYCSYCKKPFNTYTDLEEHTTKQCQKRNYECQYCGRRFSRPHEKVKHERIHTGEKPHVCEICGKAFRISFCLTLHLRTHTGNRPYTCDLCGKRFKSYSVFNHHLKIHSEVRNYKCPFCPKAFKTAVHLAGHKNSHTKPFSCTECNRPFASLYAVRAHMETHKRDNNLKYECLICGASYARSFALKDHLNEAHGQDQDVEDNNQGEEEGQNDDAAPGHGEDVQEEGVDQQVVNDGEEYQVTVSEPEICQVLEEGEEYVVHLQDAGEVPEENRMEVVDG